MVCLSDAALVRRLYVMCDPLLKGDVCYCSNGTAFRVPPASLPRYHQHPPKGPTALALARRGEQDLTLPATCLEKDSTSASTP